MTCTQNHRMIMKKIDNFYEHVLLKIDLKVCYNVKKIRPREGNVLFVVKL